jgi:hypothetical protein
MDSDYMAPRVSSPTSEKSFNKKDFGIIQSLLMPFDPYSKFNYLIVALVRVCE